MSNRYFKSGFVGLGSLKAFVREVNALLSCFNNIRWLLPKGLSGIEPVIVFRKADDASSMEIDMSGMDSFVAGVGNIKGSSPDVAEDELVLGGADENTIKTSGRTVNENGEDYDVTYLDTDLPTTAKVRKMIDDEVGEINNYGSDWSGYSDETIPTTSKMANIADSIASTYYTGGNITGTGTVGEVAYFYNNSTQLASITIATLLTTFGTTANRMLGTNGSGAYVLDTPDVFGAIPAPSGATNNDLLYYTGSAWARLPNPSTDMVLKNDAGSSGLRWADESDGLPDTAGESDGMVLQLNSSLEPVWADESDGLPDTTGESNRMVLQLNSSLEPVWDWVRAH